MAMRCERNNQGGAIGKRKQRKLKATRKGNDDNLQQDVQKHEDERRLNCNEASKYLWKAVNEQLRGATEQLREDVVQETIFRYIRARRHKGEPVEQFIPALLSKYLRFTIIDFLNKEIRPARKTQSLETTNDDDNLGLLERISDSITMQSHSLIEDVFANIFLEKVRQMILARNDIERLVLDEYFFNGCHYDYNGAEICRQIGIERPTFDTIMYDFLTEVLNANETKNWKEVSFKSLTEMLSSLRCYLARELAVQK